MRGSPSGTIGCEKRATAWRTFFTVPWGEKVTVGGAESARGAPASATRHIKRTTMMRAAETKGRRLTAGSRPALAENGELAENESIAVPLPTAVRNVVA